jgi:hypothetical protein
MSRPPKLYPKSAIPGFTDNLSTLGGVLVPFPGFELSLSSGEDKNPHRVFRTKRKHVLKACERCRVKKSKVSLQRVQLSSDTLWLHETDRLWCSQCDGNQPCNRCLTYNHACIFRDRKATQAKVYSRGWVVSSSKLSFCSARFRGLTFWLSCRFVEMLISHQATLVQALQKLYKRCINLEGFPGAPLEESPNGYPATHAILSRLGLIKHAEEAMHDPQEILAEISDYLRSVLTADCTESTEPSEPTLSGDPSPEPDTPRDNLDHLVSSTSDDHCMWDIQSVPQASTGSYPMYDCLELVPQQQHSMSQSAAGISYQESLIHSRLTENPGSCNSRYSCSGVPCQRNDPPAVFSWPSQYRDAMNLLPIGMHGNDYQIPVQEQQACDASHFYHASDSIHSNR